MTHKHIHNFVFILASIVLCTTPVFAAIDVTAFQQLVEAEKNQDSGLQEIQSEIQQKAQSVKELSEKLAVFEKNIKDAKAQQENLNNQISILDAKISSTETTIEKKNIELQVLQLEVEALQQQIYQSEAEIEQASTQLTSLLRQMYINKKKTAFEVTFGHTRFSDFFADMTYSAEVQSDVKGSLTEVRRIKSVLENRRSEIKEKQVEESVQKEALEAQKESMEGEQEFKSQLLLEVADSEEKYQELLKAVKTQQQQIEGEVAQLQRTSASRIAAIKQKVLERLNDEDDSNDELTEEEQAIIEPGPIGFMWPMIGRTRPSVTCGFHCSGYPFYFPHNGLDIGAPMRTPVYAAESGYIVRVKFDPNSSALAYVYIDHGQNLMTGYLHLNDVVVSADEYVTKGQLIGYSGGLPGSVGAGPYSTGAHLHFEVRTVVNGIMQTVDPLQYLP